MVLLRHMLGEVIRDYRLNRDMTLREVSAKAGVALGYLSEIELGKKEASSEFLFYISEAMGVRLSELLVEAGSRLSSYETPQTITVPDTIPEEFFVGR